MALIVGAVALTTCDHNNHDEDLCTAWLQFVYDYNMEYADAFKQQVDSVDVLVFGSDNKYVLAMHADTKKLSDNKMLLNTTLPAGDYQLLTFGNLTRTFRVTDKQGNECQPGVTTIDEVQVSPANRQAVISDEFPHLWVGETVTIKNYGGASVWPVKLTKDTKRFNLSLTKMNDAGQNTRANEEIPYTFEITSTGNVIQAKTNLPILGTTTTYKPYALALGTEPSTLVAGKINTLRMYDDGQYPYSLIVKNNTTGAELWKYDLMKLLVQLKPTTPDGKPLPLQEYLDRQSEWNISVLYKDDPDNPGGPDEPDTPGGFAPLQVIINGWIIWISGMHV